jgi:hypothetical protein
VGCPLKRVCTTPHFGNTTALTVGPNTLSASYAGDPAFQPASSNSVAFTVLQATTTTLTTTAATVTTGTSVTFTATVAPVTSGTPTGSVQFLNGATVLGTGALTAGKATFTTTTLPIGSDNITAVYLGDAAFTTSTSAILVEVVTGPPDFAITAAPTAVTIKQGSTGTSVITLTPANGYASAVTFTCSGLPSLATCSFSPATLTPSGAPVTTTVTIGTVATTTTTAMLHDAPGRPFSPRERSVSIVAGILLCLLPFGSRRRFKRAIVLFALLMAVVMIPLSGCGNSTSSAPKTTTVQGTPTGTTNVTITATGSSSTTTHTLQLALTVN